MGGVGGGVRKIFCEKCFLPASFCLPIFQFFESHGCLALKSIHKVVAQKHAIRAK